MLHLRLTARSERIVREAFGGIEAFQKCMNEHASWMYRQKEAREWVNGKPVTYPPAIILLNEKVKLILSVPVIDYDGKNFYNRIITIKNPTRDDRADGLSGREVKEPIEIQQNLWENRLRPPTPFVTLATRQEQAPIPRREETKSSPTGDQPARGDDDKQRFIIAPICPRCKTILTPKRGMYCQHCAHKLPPEVALHPELVVAIKYEDYKKLATHLKQAANLAWSKMMHGREIRKKVTSVGQTIFLIVVKDEKRTSTLVEEQKLEDILTETAIGRLTSDPYELREAHRMLDGRPSAEG